MEHKLRSFSILRSFQISFLNERYKKKKKKKLLFAVGIGTVGAQ